MSETINIKIKDMTPEVLRALENAIERGLDSAGAIAESEARDIIKANKRIKSGRYWGSIKHKVEDGTCYIGTNARSDDGKPYPLYHELGTGIYASKGGGRQDPWAYQDEKGNWHKTNGIKPIHALKNGVANKKAEIINTIKDSLRNA